jgi:hypothetical protein
MEGAPVWKPPRAACQRAATASTLTDQLRSPADDGVGSAARLGGRALSVRAARAGGTLRRLSIETFITTYIGPVSTA